jgi:hypothetical protein
VGYIRDMPTLTRPRVRAAAKSVAQPSRAERLVAAIRAMPIEAIRERIASSRAMTDAELLERQRAERKSRAAAAAKRLRTI